MQKTLLLNRVIEEVKMPTQAIQSLKAPRIRPVAFCIFRRNHSILVVEGHDPHKQEAFFRPLGGGVEFGEYSWETIRRQIRQALQADIQNLTFIGPAENVFELDGQVGHEIDFIFEAEFANLELYHREELWVQNDKGCTVRAVWKPLADFRRKKAILYPEGLLEMLLG